jgi:nucleotide-binding universal stress UspA family protein
VAVGEPHREILRAARNNAPDLIVMGGSTSHVEDSVYKKTSAGSTFHRVAKAAHSPVLVVTRPAASFWGGFSRIVFGTDFSEASESAFDYALGLARTFSCELFLFHAVDVSAMAAGRIIAQDDIEEQIRVALRRMRGRYLPKMEGFEAFQMDSWEGLPYVEIVKYAREKQADLMVMAHHARRASIEEAPMGGTMEQVIVRASCPVLSINRNVRK